MSIKYISFLAIGRGSEYHYWAPVVFAYKCPLDLIGEETEFFLVSRLPVPCFATSLPWDDLSTVPESCPSPNSIC